MGGWYPYDLCDLSLAIAALGLDKNALLRDVRYTGLLFESLAIQNLKVYAQSNDAKVFHHNVSMTKK